MNIAQLVFNPIRENTYLIWDATNECVVIDAGNSSKEENQALENFIEQKGLKPTLAINTHGHFDHLLGVSFLCEKYGIPFAMHKDDSYLLSSIKPGESIYGIEIGVTPQSIDIDLSQRDSITFGETTLKIIPTPGHTPGHVSLFEEQSGVLFTGDTIFRESIGRTDLPGGDYPALMNSIIENILPLGDEIKIYPGHAESTTIGHESLYNPFIVEQINK
ncbi:MAG: MBL fold metallo-hydrolase [Rikenellaceae bacterium]